MITKALNGLGFLGKSILSLALSLIATGILVTFASWLQLFGFYKAATVFALFGISFPVIVLTIVVIAYIVRRVFKFNQ